VVGQTPPISNMHTSSILLLFMFVCLTFDPHHAIVQQAEAAPPSSPIIPVIPISPIPAETTIIPPTGLMMHASSNLVAQFPDEDVPSAHYDLITIEYRTFDGPAVLMLMFAF
ncbi:hypothetical protein GOODEAATRI_006246, partial [Goodea atripinnis]